jgi:hypothetical protein
MIDTESTFREVLTEISCRDGQLIVKRTQDVEPCLEANKAELAEASSWRPYASVGGKDRGMRKVASIPNIVAEQWMREGINVFSREPDQLRKVAQKLNSNEYLHLRTAPGRVGWKA